MKIQNNIESKLNRIVEILKFQNAEPMNFESACKYLSISKSYLYKLTCKNRIPFYRPNGKKIFFEKSELNKWLLKNRSKSESELEEEANNHIKKNN